MEITYTNGGKLSQALQKEALAKYVHRFTKQHIPQWSRQPMPNGTAYPVQFASDMEWLNHTDFPMKNGHLVNSQRDSDCRSYPTWPDNPEFRNKYHNYPMVGLPRERNE